MGIHRHGQHPGHGHPGDEDHERVRGPGGEGVAPPEPHELGVGRADACDRVVLAAKGDELGGAAQELHQLGGQLPAGGGLPAAGGAGQRPGQKRHGDAADEQSGSEDDRGGREHRRRRDDRSSGGDDGDQRRADAARVEALEHVHVRHHAVEQLAAAVALELGRGERLDPLVEARPDAGQ